MRAHSRPVFGLVYLVVLGMLTTLSVLVYRKDLPWQDAVHVTLATRTPGLELNPLSDVKFQGVRVGEVRQITTDGREATVEMAIDPDHVDEIPDDVDAMIVPKTLFGEKYVDLRARPGSATTDHLSSGDRIEQSATSVELGTLFDRLVPVLQTLRPDQLSTLLGSLADALDGRGTEIAATLNDTLAFLRRLDPSLDTLVDDIRLLGSTSDVYAQGADDLLALLDNSAVISTQQLVPMEQQLADFLATVTDTSEITTDVLRDNTERIVTLNGRARPVLELLDTYSTELPCILHALHVGDRLANQATGARGSFIGLSIDMMVANDPYAYPADLPGNPGNDAYVENRPAAVPSFAPHCPRLPQRLEALREVEPYSLQPYSQTSPPRPPTTRPRTSPLPTPTRSSQRLQRGREALALALAARGLGIRADQVPGYASMLLAPLVSEGEVQVR